MLITIPSLKKSPSTQNTDIRLDNTYLFKIAGFNFSTASIAAFVSSADTPDEVMELAKCLVIASKCGCCKPIPVCV